MLRSCIARLYVLEEDYKQSMKNELKTVLSNKAELSEAALKEMTLLHNFILEVLRMHPPVPVFFGRARLVSSSYSRLFQTVASYHSHAYQIKLAMNYANTVCLTSNV